MFDTRMRVIVAESVGVNNYTTLFISAKLQELLYLTANGFYGSSGLFDEVHDA